MDSPRLLLETCAKALLGCGVLLLTVWIVEQNGTFENAPDPNDHRTKRWDYLYRMAETQKNIDVLVLGNSHAYTGLSPEYLSAALESNAFVLANPGTNVADAYWNLRELLTLHTPQLVALESYAINKTSHSEMSSSMLVDQVKAFNARRDVALQWTSLLPLFPLDDAPIASSAVARNHHFLWDGFPKRSKKKPYNLNNRYLGRFIRFTSGLSDSLLTLYENDNFVVDGRLETISEECQHYTQLIADLCKENEIELVLFTLPMFESHIAHAEAWIERYEELAQALGIPYLNLQTNGGMAKRPDYFENTRKANQHMTLNGSIRAADALGQFIDSLYTGEFHQRAEDEAWKNYHIGNRGMLVYAEPSAADTSVQVVSNGLKAPDFDIDQILLVDVPGNADIQELWVRIDNYKKAINTSEKDLILRFDFRRKDNPVMDISLRLPRYKLVQRDDMAVFRRTINRVEIVKLKAVELAQTE